MINKTNFTPGPGYKAQTDKGKPKVVDRNGFTIATAGAGPYNHDNFVLMSAAHELYEALDNLLGMIENERPDWQYSEQEEARAALAKARGEKP